MHTHVHNMAPSLLTKKKCSHSLYLWCTTMHAHLNFTSWIRMDNDIVSIQSNACLPWTQFWPSVFESLIYQFAQTHTYIHNKKMCKTSNWFLCWTLSCGLIHDLPSVPVYVSAGSSLRLIERPKSHTRRLLKEVNRRFSSCTYTQLLHQASEFQASIMIPCIKCTYNFKW